MQYLLIGSLTASCSACSCDSCHQKSPHAKIVHQPLKPPPSPQVESKPWPLKPPYIYIPLGDVWQYTLANKAPHYLFRQVTLGSRPWPIKAPSCWACKCIVYFVIVRVTIINIVLIAIVRFVTLINRRIPCIATILRLKFNSPHFVDLKKKNTCCIPFLCK